MKLISKITNSNYLFTGIGLGQSEEPFSTEAGEVFKSVLAMVDINPNLLEFRKVIDKNIPENELEIISEDNKKEFNNFIIENNIEYIVFLGRNVVTQLAHSISKSLTFNILNSMGFMPVSELNGIKGACIYHPKYIFNLLKENDDILNQYSTRIKSLLNRKDKTEFDININQISMDDFIKDVVPNIKKQDIIGIDYETNGVPVFNRDFKVTLVSISVNPNNNTIYSWWINWDTVNKSNLIKYQEFIESIKDKLWAYNCVFEIQVNWRLFNKFIPIQDAMILVTMNGTRSSLKVAVRRFLSSDFYESEVIYYRETFKKIFKGIIEGKRTTVKIDEIKEIKDYDNLITYLCDNNFPDALINDIKNLYDLYGEKDILNSFKEYPYEWGAVPRSLLGPYCCYDSAYTIPLVRKFYNQYKDGYPVYIRHAWMAAKFIANGIRWDDKVAEDQISKYNKISINCLSYLIRELSTIEDEKKLYAEDILNWKLPIEQIYYTPGGSERKRIIKTEKERLEQLKTILNPSSNTKESRNQFWNCYYTNRIELASFAYILISELRLKGIWNKYINARLLDKSDLHNEVEYIKSLNTDNLNSASNLIDDIIKYGSEENNKIEKEINKALENTNNTYKNLTYGKYSVDVINTQYEIHKLFFGLNIDDKSTWNKEFTLLYNLQLFKKVFKLLSTSINGISGRYSTFEVNKSIMSPSIRNSCWSSYKVGQEYLLDLDFNSLSAATHRWTSSFHTIPAGSPVRRILKPRTEDGIWLHMDYSQAELVILAFFSQDPDMMNVYLNKGDLHRFVASKIFDKPESEITTDERRISKTVEFGIVYGKGVEATAVDITGGNISKAQEIFDSFYKRFPGISKWMDQKKKEVDRYGKVSNLFGGMIEIDTSQPGNAKYRQACNYPIQSTSSMLAGVGMYQLIEECEKKGIPQVAYGFTHDSLDISTKIDYIFDFIDTAYEQMETRIYNELGAPMHIDIEVGVDAYSLVDISYSRIDNKIKLELDGDDNHIQELIKKFVKYSKWDIIDSKELNEKTVNVSLAEMFSAKGAFKDTWGTSIKKKKYEFLLREVA